ncbi:MAG: ABC transporter permease [Candidatus Nanohalobium sp.]
MNLRKYLEFTMMGFRTFFAYRLNAVSSFANSLIFLVLMYALWSAIATSGSLQGGLDRVLAYIVLGQVISSAVFMNVEKLLSGKIRQGTIVNELKRPISLRAQVYCHMLGIMLFNLVFVGVPLLVAGFLFLGLTFPGFVTFLAFAVSVFLAYNIVYALSYLTSMLIFWTKVGWSIRMMRTTVQRLLSGVLFPLYLLPPGLEDMFGYLPFRSMVDAPISIFMGGMSSQSVLSVFATQLFWIAVLLVLGELMWLKARKKLTVQGG